MVQSRELRIDQEPLEIIYDGKRLCQLGAHRDIGSLVFDDFESFDRFTKLEDSEKVTTKQKDQEIELSITELKRLACYDNLERRSVHIGKGAKETLNWAKHDYEQNKRLSVPILYTG